MFYMYEAIIITKILMHLCSQKGKNVETRVCYVTSLPPTMEEIYVPCKQQYVL